MKAQTKKKILFYIFLTLASIIACLKVHEFASPIRFNTNAWGGELLLLLSPLIVWYAVRNFKDYRATK